MSLLVCAVTVTKIIVYIVPATIWTIVEADITIVSACLIVSRPWLLQLWPSALISRVRERSLLHKKSRRVSSNQSDSMKGVLSNDARLSNRPPAVDASFGQPFEYDIEKNSQRDLVSIQSILS